MQVYWLTYSLCRKPIHLSFPGPKVVRFLGENENIIAFICIIHCIIDVGGVFLFEMLTLGSPCYGCAYGAYGKCLVSGHVTL